MNCSQVEELLPLYAGHDLAGRSERLVTAHLQTCVSCSLAAAGYREVRGLMNDLTAPVFEDEVYAEIRRNVWERIEEQPQTRPLFESLAVWFDPRFAWAAATALMIILSAVGLYFINREFSDRPTGIVDIPKIIVPAPGPATERHDGAPSIPGEGSPNKRQTNMPKRQRRPDRMVGPDRGNSPMAYSSDAEIAKVQKKTGAQPSRVPTGASETLALQSPDPSVIGTDNLDLAGRAPEKTLRMEIQTQNPNIRIIWFSQREPKPLTTPAKGI